MSTLDALMQALAAWRESQRPHSHAGFTDKQLADHMDVEDAIRHQLIRAYDDHSAGLQVAPSTPDADPEICRVCGDPYHGGPLTRYFPHQAKPSTACADEKACYEAFLRNKCDARGNRRP